LRRSFILTYIVMSLRSISPAQKRAAPPLAPKPKPMGWPARIVRRIRRMYTSRALHPNDWFLRKSTGVIHVGANIGQERALYARFNLDVIWVEPMPASYAKLLANLAGFPRQRGYQYLLTDKEEQEYELLLSGEDYMCSSILPYGKIGEANPGERYEVVGSLRIASSTLTALVKKERIDISHFQTLIIDTQGSELYVLRGAVELFPHIFFIKVEVADYEGYQGCCTVKDMNEFMNAHGYIERDRVAHAVGVPSVGRYYDIVYVKKGH
jgi:FkbM family methyltransferase